MRSSLQLVHGAEAIFNRQSIVDNPLDSD